MAGDVGFLEGPLKFQLEFADADPMDLGFKRVYLFAVCERFCQAFHGPATGRTDAAPRPGVAADRSGTGTGRRRAHIACRRGGPTGAGRRGR